MADEALARAGLHFDELNKIRVLEPEVSQQTGELKEECKEFVENFATVRRHFYRVTCMKDLFDNISGDVVIKFLKQIEIVDFQKIVGTFIDVVDNVAKEVEKEKMKAIGARNLLKSMTKQREAQQQQLQALITEKKMQLERLRIQYEMLQKEESDQNDFIDQFVLQK